MYEVRLLERLRYIYWSLNEYIMSLQFSPCFCFLQMKGVMPLQPGMLPAAPGLIPYQPQPIIGMGGAPLQAAPFARPAAPGAPPPAAVTSNSTQTHEMCIPNDLIGCIIGRGGAKINEIR